MKRRGTSTVLALVFALGAALGLSGCKFLEDEFVGLQKAPQHIDRLVEEWGSH